MSKVILSLLGTVEASDSGESEHIEFVRASQHHATDSDRYYFFKLLPISLGKVYRQKPIYTAWLGEKKKKEEKKGLALYLVGPTWIMVRVCSGISLLKQCNISIYFHPEWH